MKYGITSEANPEARYPKSFYIEQRVRMVTIDQFEERAPARMAEILLNIGYVAEHGRLPPLTFRY
jgi:hypothetical protein